MTECHELFTLREHLASSSMFGAVCVTHCFSVMCCVKFCFLYLFAFVLCLVCPILPMSLDCSFLIAPSVFSNVYLFCLSSSCVLCAQYCQCLWNVHSWLPLQFSLKFIEFILICENILFYVIKDIWVKFIVFICYTRLLSLKDSSLHIFRRTGNQEHCVKW